MSNAKSAHGTLLQRGDGASPEEFANVAEVVSLGGPSFARDMLDCTHMESEDGFKEFIGALIDGGEIAVEINYIPDNATHAQMITDLEDSAGNWKIIFPSYLVDDTHTFTVSTITELVTTGDAHGFDTGQPVRVSTTGTLPTSSPQVKTGKTYYVERVDGTKFYLHATNADAVAGEAGTRIDFATTGGGTHSIGTGSYIEFDGLVQNVNPTAPVEGKIGASITLKVTGVAGYSW